MQQPDGSGATDTRDLRAEAHALYLRDARSLAEKAQRDPGSVGGRGSVLEAGLARRIIALCEEYGHA